MISRCFVKYGKELHGNSCCTCSTIISPFLTNIIKFSTWDNAILVLWLVQSISVISSYTLVWPYMVNDWSKCCQAKSFFAGKRNFSLKKAKKNVFLDSWVKFRRLEVREKVRNVFVTSLRLSDHKVLHDIASVLIKFFWFRSDLLAFFARISYFLNFWSLKEFNKTIIPFALVGYETAYSQLGATRLVGYLPSHIQRALME